MVEAKVNAAAAGQSQPLGGQVPMPDVTSSVMHSATPTEFFHRCSGDYDQVQEASQFKVADLRGRHNFGVLVNLDEAYDMLLGFGLIDDSKPVAKGKTAVNPNQSAFNKLA